MIPSWGAFLFVTAVTLLNMFLLAVTVGILARAIMPHILPKILQALIAKMLQPPV